MLFVKDLGQPLALNSNDDIKESVRRLAAMEGTVPKWEFEVRQHAAGYRHDPWGILLGTTIERHIQPASQFCHDWMHAVTVSGVANVMSDLLLRTLAANGFVRVYDQLHAYLDAWEFKVYPIKQAFANYFFGSGK